MNEEGGVGEWGERGVEMGEGGVKSQGGVGDRQRCVSNKIAPSRLTECA